MRRSTVALFLSLLLVAMVGTSVSAARPAASFAARANHAEQGATLRIQAKVKHPVKRTAFSATAIVHFASGDVSLDLRRSGRSFVASGRVPVAADAALGPVVVEVTITYGGTVQTLTTAGVIEVPASEDEDEDHDEDDD